MSLPCISSLPFTLCSPCQYHLLWPQLSFVGLQTNSTELLVLALATVVISSLLIPNFKLSLINKFRNSKATSLYFFHHMKSCTELHQHLNFAVFCRLEWTEDELSWARLYAAAFLMCCDVYMWAWDSTAVQDGICCSLHVTSILFTGISTNTAILRLPKYHSLVLWFCTCNAT